MLRECCILALCEPLLDSQLLKRERPRITEAFAMLSRYRLFQIGRDELELGIEGGADTVDGNDDHDRNTGGDQAVFDGGRAGFILHETRNKVLHRVKLHVHVLAELTLGLAGVLRTRDRGRDPRVRRLRGS